MVVETMEQATFGAGCFWGVQAAFDTLPGVKTTTVGYMGGTMKNPTYKKVCTDKTGHAEVIQMHYDPEQISYEQLLDAFWNLHDPTQQNRQGPDIGSQYRSAIFYHTEQQQKIATESKTTQQQNYTHPIVTEISQATDFYPAEDYHQHYLEKQGKSSCHI